MRVRREGEKVEVRIIRLRTEWWVRTWKDRVLGAGGGRIMLERMVRRTNKDYTKIVDGFGLFVFPIVPILF